MIEAHLKLDILQGAVAMVQEGIEEVQEAVAMVQEGINMLLCPFGTTGLDRVSRGQGCDGVDQDCDGVVDECIEDQTALEICLNKDPPKPFRSVEEAVAFLESNLKVTDDCSVQFSPPNIVLLSEDKKECEAIFSVTVTDLRCPDNPTATTTETFLLPAFFKKGASLSYLSYCKGYY